MPNRRAIIARMRDVAQREYPLNDQQSRTSTFDPLVEMLFGACATELVRLENTTKLAEGEDVDRLAETLLPEVYTRPLPAFAIAQCHPTSGWETIDRNYVFETSAPRRIIVPVGENRINAARIKYRAQASYLEERTEKGWIAFAKSQTGQQLPMGTLWLGIEAESEIAATDLTFFLNQVPIMGQSLELRQLRRIKWTVGDSPCQAYYGLTGLSSPGSVHFQLSLAFYEERVAGHFQHQFVRLLPDITTNNNELRLNYPTELTHLPGEDLDQLTEKLIWIKLELPPDITQTSTEGLEVRLNCFPVMNVVSEQVTKDKCGVHSLLAFQTVEDFLCVEKVHDSKATYTDRVQLNVPATSLNTYALRTSSPEIGDADETMRLLNHLESNLKREIDMIEESINDPGLTPLLASLKSNLIELKNKLKKVNLPHHYYLDLWRESNIPETVWMTYLSTSGRRGNGLRAGTVLRPVSGQHQLGTSVTLLTTTRGGENNASDEQRKLAMCSAILSRGQIVTPADIMAYCRARIPDGRECEIYVKNEFRVGINPDLEYPQPVISIIVRYPPHLAGEDAETWTVRARDLELELLGRSSGVIPISVSCLPQNLAG